MRLLSKPTGWKLPELYIIENVIMAQFIDIVVRSNRFSHVSASGLLQL